jgi:predicted permease
MVSAWIWLEHLRNDLKYAVRGLARRPAFTIAIVFTLAIGISATTSVFSVVDAVLVRPLPYRNADRLVHIVAYRMEDKVVRALGMAQGFFVGLRERTKGLSAIGGVDSFSNLTRQRLAILLDRSEGAVQLFGTRMSPALFSMLGVPAAAGRVFDPAEDQHGRNHVIILSQRAWRTYYGSSDAVLGTTLTLDGALYTVVGVMPEGFAFPDPQTDFWIPLTPTPVPPPSAPRRDSPASGYTDAVFGQLRDGVSAEAASAEIESIMRGLDRELAAERRRPLAQIGFPESLPRRAEVVGMQEELVASVRPALRMLPFVAGLVMLIACANVGNLLLAMNTSRAREFAIRTAIGAGRGRVARQLITETMLLALLSGIIAVALGLAATRVITAMAPADIPRLGEVGLNVRVLLCALAVSAIVGLALGLLAVARMGEGWRGMTAADSPSGESGAPRFAVRDIAVVAEFAMTIVLLIGAGLLIKSLVTLINVNPGYDARNVLTFRLALPHGAQVDTQDLYARLLSRLEALPIVEAAGATDALPIVGSSAFHFVLTGLPSQRGPDEGMVMRIASPGYFRAIGTRLLEGRSFPLDPAPPGPEPILVSRTFAQRFFAGASPLGQIVGEGARKYEVVGVVDDVRHSGLDADVEAVYYVDLRQFSLPAAMQPYFAVRSALDPPALVAIVRNILRDIDPRVGLAPNVAAMSDIIGESVSRPRFNTIILTLFAAVALGLAASGIYAVMTFSVARRTREIGIRMALGARRASILTLILSRSAFLTMVGVAIGVAGAAALTRYLAAMLFGVAPLDPATFIIVPLGFAGVALVASYLPAWRAARVDPTIALRAE